MLYEDEFSQNNRIALSNLMNSTTNVVSVTRTTSCKLAADPDDIRKSDEYFNSAEQWLNYHGIETRTEYGNLLPTYNLFLKIGEWLERGRTEGRDE